MRITNQNNIFGRNNIFGPKRRNTSAGQGAQVKSVVAGVADNVQENAQTGLRQAAAQTAAVSKQDRVALSAEARLAAANAVYQALTGTDNKLENEKKMAEQAAKAMQESLQRQKEAAKDEAEAAKEAMDYMLKMMEIARRISTGGQVPGSDEQKLLEYSQVLYTMAKTLAMSAKEHEKYDSLFEDEEQAQDGGSVEAAGGVEGAPAAAGGGDVAAAAPVESAPVE